jgi:hypothetical protein
MNILYLHEFIDSNTAVLVTYEVIQKLHSNDDCETTYNISAVAMLDDEHLVYKPITRVVLLDSQYTINSWYLSNYKLQHAHRQLGITLTNLHIPKHVPVSTLVGKTITQAMFMEHPDYDDKGYVRLEFTDGTTVLLTAYNGEYTGNSRDECPNHISITDRDDNLIPVIE